MSNSNLQMNFINQLLETLKNAKSILHLKTIFGGRFCWYAINKQMQQRNLVFIMFHWSFWKYARAGLLKFKKGITIVNAFQSILGNLKRKPNKISFDQSSQFHNSSFKKWVKRQWHKNFLNIIWRKICCCWKIY